MTFMVGVVFPSVFPLIFFQFTTPDLAISASFHMAATPRPPGTSAKWEALDADLHVS